MPRKTPSNGGYIFAEGPDVEAPEARILWHADIDPNTLSAMARPAEPGHPDAVDPQALNSWLTVVTDRSGEHAVLSDGRQHIRIDLTHGSLLAGGPVVLHYRLYGLAAAKPKILPLRRLLDLCRRRRFARSLYPPDPRIDRWILALRVHDAIISGASQSEIVSILFDANLLGDADGRRSDSLRSRVRRLVADSRHLAGGGYRDLLKTRT